MGDEFAQSFHEGLMLTVSISLRTERKTIYSNIDLNLDFHLLSIHQIKISKYQSQGRRSKICLLGKDERFKELRIII